MKKITITNMKKIIPILLAVLLTSCTWHQEHINGVVVDKLVVGDRYGNANYHTVVKTKYGYIKDFKESTYFSSKVGDEITIDVTVFSDGSVVAAQDE
jgi:hypothetical protein